LIVGLPIDQVAFPYCGRVSATVRYEALEPYFSGLGLELIAAVRPPS
jgi:hypothetical protein